MNRVESDYRLWQIISPAFPVGMYSWSTGFEYAIEAGWVDSPDKTADWIAQQLRLNLSYVDIPILKRFYLSWQNNDRLQLEYWSDYLYAIRESKELVDEDLHLGKTLLRVLTTLGIPQLEPWRNFDRLSYLLMFACACVHWQVEIKKALHAYVWSWLENQVSVAVKTIPIGHLAGQTIISRSLEPMNDSVNRGISLSDENIGMGLPGFAIASALHEKQYSRLFRS